MLSSEAESTRYPPQLPLGLTSVSEHLNILRKEEAVLFLYSSGHCQQCPGLAPESVFGGVGDVTGVSKTHTYTLIYSPPWGYISIPLFLLLRQPARKNSREIDKDPPAQISEEMEAQKGQSMTHASVMSWH